MTKEQEMLTLSEEVTHCTDCTLRAECRNTVPGSGDIHGSIMFVGTSPGKVEDTEGQPFLGRSGQYLRQMIRVCNVPLNKCMFDNIVRCRIADNREPGLNEIDTCWKWMTGMLQIVRPKIIVTLGMVPLRVLGARLGFSKKIKGRKIHQIAGQIVYYAERRFYVLPMYDPKEALRRRDIQQDFESHMYLLAKGYDQWEQRKT